MKDLVTTGSYIVYDKGTNESTAVSRCSDMTFLRLKCVVCKRSEMVPVSELEIYRMSHSPYMCSRCVFDYYNGGRKVLIDQP